MMASLLSFWRWLSPVIALGVIFWPVLSEASLPACQHIDAAVRWASNNRTYFFSQNEFILYNDYYDAEEDVFPVSEIARGFPSSIDAAVRWFGRGTSYYFKGCRFYKLVERRQRLRRRHMRRLGLPCDVDAAVNTGQEILVFKGCRHWHFSRTSRRASPDPRNNSDLGLPCDVHAALTWRNGTVYVIKDDVIWTLATERSPARSTHIDEWSLCSWPICEGNSTARVADALLQNHTCNGDSRFCSLKFDQATLAGSHNAGSGFDSRGFMLFGCWVRNHQLSVLEQLRLGIRYLDVDPSWQHCGLLGTYHNFVCGGPVCRMLKQIKQFLRENRHEVVAITFNHEMTNHEQVIPALVRQLTSQLHPYLNSQHSSTGIWPTLGHAVQSNQRLFVIVDEYVETMTLYRNNQWIHSERMLHGTWRADVNVEGDCESVRHAAKQQCRRKASASILEIAVFGTSTSCVTTVADLCLPLVHELARDCGKSRHVQGKAPNVLLVDFPERAPSDAESVTVAAYFQNIRNLASLRQSECRVHIDAAVTWGQSDGSHQVMFFSGQRAVVVKWEDKLQAYVNTTASVPVDHADHVDAAYVSGDGLRSCTTSGCDLNCWERSNPGNNEHYSLTALGLPCNLDAAFTRGTNTYLFKGCQYWRRSSQGHVTGPLPITDFSVPCDLSAAVHTPGEDTVYFFKGDVYWTHNDQTRLSAANDVLDWSADLLHCV